jgi:hypothetical protein
LRIFWRFLASSWLYLYRLSCLGFGPVAELKSMRPSNVLSYPLRNQVGVAVVCLAISVFAMWSLLDSSAFSRWIPTAVAFLAAAVALMFAFCWHRQQLGGYFRITISDTANGSKASGGGKEDTPLPFQNRELEIARLATMLLTNFRLVERRGSSTGAESQYRLRIVTAAQMFGSGKSSLGVNVLTELTKTRFDTLRKDLSKTFGDELVQKLVKLKHIGIDLRHSNQGLSPLYRVRDALVRALLRETPHNEKKDASQHFDGSSRADWNCLAIVEYFEKSLKSSFLLHFDEVDRLLPSGASLPESAKTMYEFWTEIHPIHNQGNSALFCSGRSPILYLMGQGRFQWMGLASPDQSGAECILLDALKEAHVKAILRAENIVIQGASARLITRRTGGVPRFVAHAVRFLQNGTCPFSV